MSEARFAVDDIELVGHLARPRTPAGTPVPGVVIAHGFPGRGRGDSATLQLPELAERLAHEMGWSALTFSFRGCGRSGGDFSLGGWLADLGAAVDHLTESQPLSGTWLVGFGTGGPLCLCLAAQRPEVRGVATLGAPADFNDWASHPRRLLQHARELGLIRDADHPVAFDRWARSLREVSAASCVGDVAPRPLLVVHGADDELVPSFDARVIGDAHGDAELRILDGAGHHLRYDPRAVAILLGWLDRQRHRAPV